MKKTKGFTVIEMLVSIILIAIISVGAFEFFGHCRRFIVDTELRLSAANFSRETMEGHSWNFEITNTTNSDWEDDAALPTGEEFGSRLYEEYSGARQYKVETSADGDYNIIEVKVSWNY
ncbi:MAG: type II secretion system protein [Candidatus Omnitrophota bacterium]